MITVILNCYKRPQYLQEQINAIRNQTIKPEEVFIWYNRPEDGEQYNINELGCKVSTCNHNFKFHGRFAFGLLAQTKYVAFFDDDTIPGNKWFENCLDTINSGSRGILGSTGIYLNGSNYQQHTKIGWNGTHNTEPYKVDLVGHSWFMHKNYLRYMWYENPISWENGEDIQLSFLAKMKGDVDTFVPPHPENDVELWGSLPDRGSKYGNDNQSSWRNSNHMKLRDEIVTTYVKRGYVTVKNRTTTSKISI